MGVRVGVDVGGTFTKAVAIEVDALGLRVVAQSVLPTTHDAPEGVAAGVVAAVAEVAGRVGPERVELVTHSTTQAVNALLEGDVGAVGMVGLGRRPELKRARKRTELQRVELSAGKSLRVVPAFFDVTDGFDDDGVRAAIAGFRAAGVASVAVAEAFAPDDPRNEQAVTALAHEAGLPACASTELSGLYGLEMRAVTAAVNASILPIALRTADYVEHGVVAAGIRAPVMVMRGDGGATDLARFRREPARTLYSGPAASVAGALRHGGITDGVVVEVGGTSTNVAAIRYGRPALSYVQVASHVTALRAVDVRVVGVAGGSMLRVRRGRVYGVGPRSAHIAGFGYACFTDPGRLAGAVVEEVAPLAGDPADHLVLRLPDGARVALTNTCAANALGVTRPGDYAHAGQEAAALAFGIAGRHLRLDGPEVARRMLVASGEAVAELVSTVLQAHQLHDPVLVAVGGGAGGLGRHVASLLRLEVDVPDGAEVISSIGDALSLVRAERERTVQHADRGVIRALMAEVRDEAIAAGASPQSLEVRVEEQPEKGTVRAIATGAVGLQAGAVPGREPAGREQVAAAAAPLGGGDIVPAGGFWLAVRPGHVVVLDRFAEPAARVAGDLVRDASALPDAVVHHTRYRGPVTLRPSIWVLHGTELIELSSGDVAAAAQGLADGAADGEVLFVVGQAR